jgi:hypothetical protein
MSTKRIHSFSVSHFVEDSISPINIKRIMDYPSPLKIGDYMLIEENPSNYEKYYYYNLAAQLLKRICRDFSFQETESSLYGISVVRLIPHDESSKEYCEKINQLKIKVYDQY